MQLVKENSTGNHSFRGDGPRAQGKPLALIWICCPFPVITKGLQSILSDDIRVHAASSPPDGATPDLIVLCPHDAVDPVPELEYLRGVSPGVPVLILGVGVANQAARAAIQAGARGFLHFRMQPAQILNALSLAHAGEVVMPGEILRDLVMDATPADAQILTSRQREILTLVAEGLTNAQIAERLSLSESSIKQHLHHAYKLMGVKNRTEAAKLFRGD